MNLNDVVPEAEHSTEIPLTIGQGGLSAPLPIHAYRILGRAREHIAKDVLLCLISHLGFAKKNKKVNPSYKTISFETGRSSNSVSKGIRTLEEYGFVRKYTIQKARNRKSNVYYIQESCYQTNLMNEKARSQLPIVGRCECGSPVREGEYGIGLDGYHHYRCGALVSPLKSRKLLRNQLPDTADGQIEKIMYGTNFQSLQSTDSPLRGSEN